MTGPLHSFPPVRLPRPADEVHRGLVIDTEPLVAAATADALQHSAPLLRRWGLTASMVPSVVAAPTSDGELGSITLRWSGDESATGWPAMSAQLLVTPTGPTSCDLTLATTRTPDRGLAAPQLDDLHRRQATQVVVDGFLHALAEHLDRVPSRRFAPTGAAR